MPYTIVKKNKKWYVYNKESGKLKGKHTSRLKAEAQVRLLYGVEHGWKPSKKAKH